MAKLNKDELIKAVEEMSVLELSELVKALEEKLLDKANKKYSYRTLPHVFDQCQY